MNLKKLKDGAALWVSAIFCWLFLQPASANPDTTYFLKVHFLYGSKPKKEYRQTERSWFGGKLGGHVGIEYAPNKVLNFVPSGRFHLVAHKHRRHSKFVVHANKPFWELFGGNAANMKTATITIPITAAQKARLDSLAAAYTAHTPYDYAFLGMRCSAAAYDVLSKLDIVPRWGNKRTMVAIFYPRKLRKRLFKLARTNNWQIERQEGSYKRKWEGD